MALTREEVRRVAELARLALGPEEEGTFAEQLARVVGEFDRLATFEDAEESVAAASAPGAADVPQPGLPRATVLDNAPASFGDFVAVPRIFGNDD